MQTVPPTYRADKARKTKAERVAKWNADNRECAETMVSQDACYGEDSLQVRSARAISDGAETLAAQWRLVA